MSTITITIGWGDNQTTFDVEYNLKTTFREWFDTLRWEYKTDLHDISMFANGTKFDISFMERNVRDRSLVTINGMNGKEWLTDIDDALYLTVDIETIEGRIKKLQDYRDKWVALLNAEKE